MYLIAAVTISPAFFLGPLGALLLVSRPRTLREWLWIAISIGALAAWLRLPTSLADHTARASAAFFVGAFVALTLVGIRSLFTRSVLAVIVAALAMIAWFAAFQLRFAALENELITRTWETWRLWLPDLPAAMPPGTDVFLEGAVPDRARQFASTLTIMAALFPAGLALNALLGVRLAWGWYQRIACTPIMPPAKPFRDFRFNDQMVWVVVVSLATLLISSSRPVTLVAANVLAVVGVLYAARGAAIIRTSLLRATPVFVGILVLMMLALFSVIPVVLTLLGIADTWVDFRRRMAPPSGAPS